jgi:hypothetical protein
VDAATGQNMSFQMPRAVRDCRTSVTASTRRESVQRLDFRGLPSRSIKSCSAQTFLGLVRFVRRRSRDRSFVAFAFSLDAAVFGGRRNPRFL